MSGVSPARGDATRDALIAAALTVFARDGFDASGTRRIAERAGINPALIGYHFGSKEGLYRAVFEHIAATMHRRFGPVAEKVAEALAATRALPSATARGQAAEIAVTLTLGFFEIMSDEASEDWALLLVREQQAPTPAFDTLYVGLMGRLLGLMTEALAIAHGTTDETEARLDAMGMIGCVLISRVGRASLMRHLGWSELGPSERAALRRSVERTARRLLRTGDSPCAGC